MNRHPHLGELIEQRISDLGMTKAEFGRRIGISRQHVNSLLKKSSFDTLYLAQICNLLEEDFFRHLTRTKPVIEEPPKAFIMFEVPPDKAKSLI